MAFDFPNSPVVGQLFSPVAGVIYAYNGYGWALTSSAASAYAFGGYLSYVDLTHLQFKPFNGSYILINGAAYAIPIAGIQGLTYGTNLTYINGVLGTLATGTNYYVYVWNNGGQLWADFSTTGHVTSQTPGNVGTEIKNGDDTRTLIGFIRCGSPAGFYDAPANRYVLSWFNRNKKSIVGPNVNGAGIGTSMADVGGYAYFLIWANQSLFIISLAGQLVPTGGNTVYAYVGMDSVNQSTQATGSSGYTTNVGFPGGSCAIVAPSEGYHYIHNYAACSASGAYVYTTVMSEVWG